MTRANSILTTLVFFMFTYHAVASIRRTHGEFGQHTSLRPSAHERVHPLRRFTRLWTREFTPSTLWGSETYTQLDDGLFHSPSEQPSVRHDEPSQREDEASANASVRTDGELPNLVSPHQLQRARTITRQLTRSVSKVVRTGWLRKAPSWRLEWRQQQLAVGGAGRGVAIAALPILKIEAKDERYFVLRASVRAQASPVVHVHVHVYMCMRAFSMYGSG